ncbi:hypothetical protein BH11MYX2_BH11MYX2_19840 [soil metagenome]
MRKRRELFATFLDWDRADLNELIDSAQQADVALETTNAQVQKLQALVRELSVIVAVQGQMLVEAGVLDREELEARIDQLFPKPPPRPSTVPGEMPSTLRCYKCQRDVQPSSTVMTANGPMCDPRCAV